MSIGIKAAKLSHVSSVIKDQLDQWLPVRCQICGHWGYSKVGPKWICDACYACICFGRAVSHVSQNGEC